MARRNWKEWPNRFGHAIIATGGVVGLVGIGIAAVGTTVAGPVVTIVGAVTIGGALLYAGCKGIPPKMLPASERVGLKFSLDELKSIDPCILKLGIVGTTQSGKTTFTNFILQKSPETSRTNKIYATIVALQTTPPLYVALLDGDGYQMWQQFEIAEKADFILVLVDHNQSNVSINTSNERIKEHDNFLKQIEFHIKNHNCSACVHLLFNKRDLWERSRKSSQLLQWFDSHVSHWKAANIAGDISSDIHSNLITDDMVKVVARIAGKAKTL